MKNRLSLGAVPKDTSLRLGKLYRKEYLRAASLQHVTAAIVGNLVNDAEVQLPSRLQMEICDARLRRFPQNRDRMEKIHNLGHQWFSLVFSWWLDGSRQVDGQVDAFQSNRNLSQPAIAFTKPELMTEEKIRHHLDLYVASNQLQGMVVMPKGSPEPDIRDESRDTLLMLIGAIYLNNGPKRTESFIIDRIIKGKRGIIRLGLINV